MSPTRPNAPPGSNVPPSRNAEPEADNGQGVSILVVDDSQVMRRAVLRTLGSSGLVMKQVHEGNDGREALAVLDRERVDILLLDLDMPGMDGVQVAEVLSLAKRFAGTPTVVITADHHESTLSYLRRLGVSGIVPKPFSTEQLKAAVSAAVPTSHWNSPKLSETPSP